MRYSLILLSAFAFLFYGLMILLSGHMKAEFRRYRMERFRTLTGYLEVAGGAGQFLGLSFPYLLIAASAGLAVLMLLGTIVRIRTKDPWVEIIPAFALMILNSFIVVTELF